MGRLAVKFHAVMHGHVIPALLLRDEVWVHIAQLFRDAEGQMHPLPGAYRTEGLLEIGVKAIEQTRQSKRIDPFSKKPKRRQEKMKIFCENRELYPAAKGSPFGRAGAWPERAYFTAEACQMSRA